MKTFKEFLAEGKKTKGKVIGLSALDNKGLGFIITDKGDKPNQDQFHMYIVDKKMNIKKDMGSHPSKTGAIKFAKTRGYDVSLNESSI